MKRYFNCHIAFALTFTFILCETISAQANFTSLVSFDITNGSVPGAGALIKASDGNFYGTTQYGGANGYGEVYQLTPAGELNVIYSFCNESPFCADGGYPVAGLVEYSFDNHDVLVGTTTILGAHNCGTVFELSFSGELTTVYNFCSKPNDADGYNPYGAFVATTKGLIGTTNGGGAHLAGTIFLVQFVSTTKFKFKTLYSFCSKPNCADGSNPVVGLTLGPSGTYFGATENGGANGYGTVFETDADGGLTTIYSFCSQAKCSDGGNPNIQLAWAAREKKIYGTTPLFGPNQQGTVFSLTEAGKLTVLHSFCDKTNCPDGASPQAGVILGSDGNFFGTTTSGGSNNQGTIFEITATGALTTLYNFCSQVDCTDGELPTAPLLQASDGAFYGTTAIGGVYGPSGTVFKLDLRK
jgi:uncharacterized repeat protein (TIGR03803 family)